MLTKLSKEFKVKKKNLKYNKKLHINIILKHI